MVPMRPLLMVEHLPVVAAGAGEVVGGVAVAPQRKKLARTSAGARQLSVPLASDTGRRASEAVQPTRTAPVRELIEWEGVGGFLRVTWLLGWVGVARSAQAGSRH